MTTKTKHREDTLGQALAWQSRATLLQMLYVLLMLGMSVGLGLTRLVRGEAGMWAAIGIGLVAGATLLFAEWRRNRAEWALAALRRAERRYEDRPDDQWLDAPLSADEVETARSAIKARVDRVYATVERLQRLIPGVSLGAPKVPRDPLAFHHGSLIWTGVIAAGLAAYIAWTGQLWPNGLVVVLGLAFGAWWWTVDNRPALTDRAMDRVIADLESRQVTRRSARRLREDGEANQANQLAAQRLGLSLLLVTVMTFGAAATIAGDLSAWPVLALLGASLIVLLGHVQLVRQGIKIEARQDVLLEFSEARTADQVADRLADRREGPSERPAS